MVTGVLSCLMKYGTVAGIFFRFFGVHSTVLMCMDQPVDGINLKRTGEIRQNKDAQAQVPETW